MQLQRTKRKILSRIGRPRNAGPYLKVFEDDVFIVSYPRSGNTWMRFLLGAMIYDQDVDFENMEAFVPDIYRCTNRFMESLERPRYIKSHEPFDKRYPKAIYLVRDPRDVAISYFRWLQKFRKIEKSFDGFIEDFVQDKTRYGGWGTNVNSWVTNADRVSKGLLIVRYEDLLLDTANKLQEIAAFLGFDIPKDRLDFIVNQNKFDKMKQKEASISDSNYIKGERGDIRFVRKGTTGQWKVDFSIEQAAMFQDAYQAIADKVGYDLRYEGVEQTF